MSLTRLFGSKRLASKLCLVLYLPVACFRKFCCARVVKLARSTRYLGTHFIVTLYLSEEYFAVVGGGGFGTFVFRFKFFLTKTRGEEKEI